MQGRTAVFHAMGDVVQPTELRNVTSNIFTQPEIATVGYTQKDIEEGRVIATPEILTEQMHMANRLGEFEA